MSGRTLQVGQVWEHWAERDRIRIEEIGVNWVKGTMATKAGVQFPKITLLHDTILGQYICIGELEP